MFKKKCANIQNYAQGGPFRLTMTYTDSLTMNPLLSNDEPMV